MKLSLGNLDILIKHKSGTKKRCRIPRENCCNSIALAHAQARSCNVIMSLFYFFLPLTLLYICFPFGKIKSLGKINNSFVHSCILSGYEIVCQLYMKFKPKLFEIIFCTWYFTYWWQFKIPFVLLELVACHTSLVEKFSHICKTHTTLNLSGKFICLYQATLDINNSINRF